VTYGSEAGQAAFTPGVNMLRRVIRSIDRATNASWPEGDYLFKLVAITGHQRYGAATFGTIK